VASVVATAETVATVAAVGHSPFVARQFLAPMEQLVVVETASVVRVKRKKQMVAKRLI